MRNEEDDIVAGFYEASTDPVRWGAAMRRLGDRLHAPAGGLYSELHAETQSVTGLDALYGYGPTAIADYIDHYCTLNPFNQQPRRFRLGEVSTDTALERRHDLGRPFEDLEYYRDWARPQGVRHVMGQYVEGSGSERLIATYWRPADAGAFSAEEMEFFGRMMRHTRRARDIGTRLRTAEGEMEALTARMTAAVLTLGRDGRLRQANEAANALLIRGEGLRSENGRLRTAVPEDQTALDRLVAWSLDPRSAALAESSVVPVRRSDGGPPLTLRALAVAHRFDPFLPDRSASVILTIEGVAEEGHEERLRRRLGFSRAEARVALEVLAGRSPAAAAERLGLSVETVRSHLKRLYARTGTRGQGELSLLLRRVTER